MAHWIFSLLILLFGFLTGFSIGVFFLPIGAALLLLGPVRHRTRLYWPLLMAVVGFVVGYLLFVPLTCTATTTIAPPAATETVCRSILGPEYRIAGLGQPPTDLARLAGAIAALAAAAVTLGGLLAAERHREPGPSAASG